MSTEQYSTIVQQSKAKNDLRSITIASRKISRSKLISIDTVHNFLCILSRTVFSIVWCIDYGSSPTYAHLKRRAPVKGPKIHAAVLLDANRPMCFARFSCVVHFVNILVVTVMVCLTRPTIILERISAVNPPYVIIK